MKSAEIFRIKVAETVFSISAPCSRRDFFLPESYGEFSTDQPVDVTILVHYDGLRDLEGEDLERIFDSGESWAFRRLEDRNVILLGGRSLDDDLYGFAVLDQEVDRVDVHLEPETLPDGRLPDPLQFPLGEILMICRLGGGGGIMAHACGVDDNGQGYLFAGNSTHGKSTMARLWSEEATILNDDRIVLRSGGEGWLMYGTPWHGEYSAVSPRGVPLEKIFFLHHGAAAVTCALKGAAAAAKLFARSFLPLWNSDGVGQALACCEMLAREVPCFDLDFAPDKRVVEAVRCAN